MNSIDVLVRYYHNGQNSVYKYPTDTKTGKERIFGEFPVHGSFQSALNFLKERGYVLADSRTRNECIGEYTLVIHTFVEQSKFDRLLEGVVEELCEYTLDEFIEAVQERIPVNDFELPGRSTVDDFLYILRTIRNWPYDD